MRPHSTVRTRQSTVSFTLIEVLITVVILSTGIISVLRAFEISLFALGKSRDSLWATMLIREKMAETEMTFLEEGHDAPLFSNGRFSGLYKDFRWTMETSQIREYPQASVSDGNQPDTLNEVVVTVWRESSDREHSATTYLRRVSRRSPSQVMKD